MGVFLVALVVEGPHDRLLGGGLLLLIVTLGLVRGVWAAWLFLVVVAVSGIVAGFDWPTWRGAAEIVAVNALMLVLLLASSTRRFTRRGRPRFLGRLGSRRLM